MQKSSDFGPLDEACVSVVIPYSPAHTPSEMLREAKESVERQPISTEIIVIKDTEQRGPAWARNQGIEKANSKFIAFLDADDRWKPNKLKRQLELLKKYNAGICIEGSSNERGPIDCEALTERILFGNLSSLTSSILIDTHRVDTRFHENIDRLEDHLFIIEAAIEGGACFVSGPVVEINKHDEGLSARTVPEQTHNALLFISERLSEHPEMKKHSNQAQQLAYYGLGRQRQLQGQYLSSARHLRTSLLCGFNNGKGTLFAKSIAALMLIPWLSVKKRCL